MKLSVQPRTNKGNKVKSLRRNGFLPANIIGPNTESTMVKVAESDFSACFKAVGETNLVSLTVEGEKKERRVLIYQIEYHPVTEEILHVDFYEPDLSRRVTVTVPVELSGKSKAVSEKGGILITSTSEITVETLPTNIPDVLTIDISGLEEYDQLIRVSDIVDAYDFDIVSDHEAVLCAVRAPKMKKPADSEEGENVEAVEGAGEAADSADSEASEHDEK